VAFAKALADGAVLVKKPETNPWGQIVGYVRDNNGFFVEIYTSMNG
jgi:lactoylglutathione lyase